MHAEFCLDYLLYICWSGGGKLQFPSEERRVYSKIYVKIP